MDNAIRNEWTIDTARLTVNVLEPRTPQLRQVLEEYVHELKDFPDFDPRLKPKIYVKFEILNQDSIMRIYMDHAVSMHGLEGYSGDTIQSPFCGVFSYEGLDVSIWKNNADETCFENLIRIGESTRSVDYAYDFTIKNGKVRMVNNFHWSFTKKFILKGGDFVLIEKKYIPTYVSRVSSGVKS